MGTWNGKFGRNNGSVTQRNLMQSIGLICERNLEFFEAGHRYGVRRFSLCVCHETDAWLARPDTCKVKSFFKPSSNVERKNIASPFTWKIIKPFL
jgi:hypothetical protein